VRGARRDEKSTPAASDAHDSTRIRSRALELVSPDLAGGHGMEQFTVAALAAGVAAKGFETIFSEITKRVFRKLDNSTPTTLKPSHFRDHCARTFERCTRIKTLLSRDESVDMLAQYVNIKLRTKKRSGDKIIDDFDAISKILENRRATIVGTAGSGKTVFMRYLWVSVFANSDSRIPIYLELRRLNDLTSVDIESFIFHNIIATDEKHGMDAFLRWISEGDLYLFLMDSMRYLSTSATKSKTKFLLYAPNINQT